MESHLSSESVTIPGELVIERSGEPDGRAIERPQWVILGIQTPRGAAVLASSRLSYAELQRRYEDEVKDSSLGKMHLRKEHDAVVILCDGFTLIQGGSYRECMLSLPGVWSPPEVEQGIVSPEG